MLSPGVQLREEHTAHAAARVPEPQSSQHVGILSGPGERPGRQAPERSGRVARLHILFIGDVFGQPGREALLRWLPGFRDERAVDFVIANGENVANGAGITSKLALRLLAGGVDILTTGNHVWRQKEVYAFLVTDERIVRPANYPSGAPGAGSPCGRPPTAARWPSSTWPASCS